MANSSGVEYSRFSSFLWQEEVCEERKDVDLRLYLDRAKIHGLLHDEIVIG